ncbi:MAG: DNA translocase FtsK [Bilifractor sp.]
MIFRENAHYHTGGGIVGGFLVQLFGRGFGVAGAYVIIVIALVIFTLLLTQKSLFSLIRSRSEYLYDTRDIRLQEREEKRMMRQEKRDAALARRQREAALRMKAKERRLAAEETTRAAKLVTPQTIPTREDGHFSGSGNMDSASKTELHAEDLAPILSDLVSPSAEESDLPSGVHASALHASHPGPVSGEASVHTEASTDASDGHTVPDTDRRVFSADAIPDEIISNGRTPAVEERKGIQASADFIAGKAASTEDVQKTSADGSDTLPADKHDKISAAHASAAPEKRTAGAEEIHVPDPEDLPEAEYVFPPIDLLNPPKRNQKGDSNEHLKATAAKLQQTLHNFGVEVTINHISCGPTVTQYELTPQMGVKVSKILSLQDDIKLNLAATDVRIEAPIPGKAAIGIEVPNKTNMTVSMRELLESEAFQNASSRLAICVGKDIAGQPVVADIAKMPHLLIAGATGSGKSVCINTFIMSILYKSRPDEVKFIMIDPKVVELSVYNGIPHLLIPVVTDPKKAAGALNWAVSEMTDRYQKFAEMGVRDLKGYNEKIETMPPDESGNKPRKMFRIVIVVDELADLMMVAQNEVEDAICRLAQLARACGIHLIIATQRPSVNVITGLIKANMPSRIALSVTSGVDSRTIIDMNGAEKLLGKGDMLFYPQGYQKPARIQGAFLTDAEISNVVNFLKENHRVLSTSEEKMMQIQEAIDKNASGSISPSGDAMDTDSYFADAGKLIIEKDKASIGMLQRAFRIGFNRAARIMDQLCDAGVVGEEEGTKPRKILMSMEQFENYLEEN